NMARVRQVLLHQPMAAALSRSVIAVEEARGQRGGQVGHLGFSRQILSPLGVYGGQFARGPGKGLSLGIPTRKAHCIVASLRPPRQDALHTLHAMNRNDATTNAEDA